VYASDVQKLRMYGLSQQATQGDIPADVRDTGSIKASAWAACAGIPRAEAKRGFVAALQELVPDWQTYVQQA
jgi:acyl-CoA-binding protein